MPRPPNLAGHWTGYYVQRDEQHLLAAEFRQDGTDLTGSMFDRDTNRDESLFEMAARAGWAPGQDEQITRWIREQIPEQPRAPIRAVTRKTMHGEHFIGYRVGNKEIGVTIRRHTIHYKGRLSDDGRTLEGRWWIDARKDYNAGQRTEGDFLLQRE